MKVFICLLLLTICLSPKAQRTDKKLEQEIRALLKDFHGQSGVYVFNLEKNKEVSINANAVFTTASIVKVPILVGVMDKINRGELQYHQPLIYKDSLLYAGEDILGSFKNDETIDLGKVMMLMLTTSDNTASLWLQSLADKGDRINGIMDSLGLKNTRVNSRTQGREAARAQYGWGQTSPREMATLLRQIAAGQVLGQQASGKMLRLLSRNYWDDNGLSQIPPGVFVASKNGAVDASRSEVVYVNGKDCEYVFCICTQNNADTSWTPGNEALVLIRKISLLLWKHFNPKSTWQPVT